MATHSVSFGMKRTTVESAHVNLPIKRRHMAVMLALGLLAPAVHTGAEPPSVVKCVPAPQATDVDPSLGELRVEFSQPMAPGGYSVVGGGPEFPQFVGKPRWQDERTFTWSWRLEPEHDYWLSINNASFTNFRSRDNEAVTPFPLSFRTGKSTGTAEVGRAKTNRDAITILKRAIDDDYSYRDLRHVDWGPRFAEFSPRLEAATTPRQFADLAAQLLAPAQDIHLFLRVGDETIGTWQRRAAWNVARNLLPQRIPGWERRSACVSTGVFDDGIRYVSIGGWPADGREMLEPAYQQLADAAKAGKPLVVDVRANGGGSENLAAEFAGCFIDKPAAYAKSITRSNGVFGQPVERTVAPNRARPAFRNRVVVLAGLGTVSSSESFVMMMKCAPDCRVVGDKTAGCSGNPSPVDLGNGVTAYIPRWKDLRLDGSCFEGEGIAPDVEVKLAGDQLSTSDPVLSQALTLLREPALWPK
jgi:hypothetical protein